MELDMTLDKYTVCPALHKARLNLAHIWRTRHQPDARIPANYPFWRRNALIRVARCKAAIARERAFDLLLQGDNR
jgi:hypothetical protein